MSATAVPYTRGATEHLIHDARNGVRIGYILGTEGTGLRIEKIEDTNLPRQGQRLNRDGTPYAGIEDGDSPVPSHTILLGTHKWDRPTIAETVAIAPAYAPAIYAAIAAPDGLPDSRRHVPDTGYFAWLCSQCHMSRRQIAADIGITSRAMRYYAADSKPIPYATQYAIERLASRNNP